MGERKKITIGILAHVDAGKTTLSEAMLYKTGTIRKLGRVDHGDAVLDSDAQEKERGITIYAGQAVFVLPEGTEVTLLDTPGHVDFSAEMERALRVLDYAVLVVSGKDGVQSHTWTLWKLLRQYGIPVFIFVNKMDLDGTDRGAVMDELRLKLDSACCDMNALTTADGAEEIAVCSEELLEEYLAEGTLSEDSIAKAVKTRQVFPCYFGSALKMEGVDELMDALGRFTIGYEPKESAQQDAPCASDGVEYRVFRVTRDKQGERLTHMKILRGTLRVRDEIAGEKVNQIRIYSGDKYQTVDEAGLGVICQITGLAELLPDGKASLQALMVYGISLPDGVNVHDAYGKLRQLGEEDPQLDITWNEQTREIQLKLMGEVQLEVLQELIKRRFGMDVTFSEGRIAYKETIAAPVEGAGHYEPLRHYAEVHLLLEPLPRGSGMEFGSAVSEDVLARNWQRLIMTHLLEKEHRGTLLGAPVTDMRMTIIAGRAHEKHTEGGDFRQATYRAIRQGLRKSLAAANMVLLEPWYDFELEVPRAMAGRGMADVQRMSGSCGAPDEEDSAGGMVVLRGRAPVSEMKDYVTEVASYTKGRGRLALRFGGYDVCHNQEEVVAQAGYDPDADLADTADSVFCSHGAGHNVRWDKADEMMHLTPDRQGRGETGSDAAMQTGPAQSAASGAYAGAAVTEDKELQRIFDRTYKSSKQDKPSIEARQFDSELERRKKAAERRRRAAEAEKRQNEMFLPEYLLVDGYNIIFAWEELRELAKENIDSAREALIEILGNYQGFRKCNVIAVFDAYKVKGGQRHFERHGEVTVVYTQEAETADAYIERTTYELSGKGGQGAKGPRYRVRVATSDRLEQMIVLGNNAQRVSANDLKEEVKQVNEEISAFLKQLARRNEIENPNKLKLE